MFASFRWIVYDSSNRFWRLATLGLIVGDLEKTGYLIDNVVLLSYWISSLTAIMRPSYLFYGWGLIVT